MFILSAYYYEKKADKDNNKLILSIDRNKWAEYNL